MGSASDREISEAAKLFKALGNECRLQALEQLRTGEKCACELLNAIDISQPNLSHHMKVLCESGIVTARQDGKWTYYRIDKDVAQRTADRFSALVHVDPSSTRPSRCRSKGQGPGCC